MIPVFAEVLAQHLQNNSLKILDIGNISLVYYLTLERLVVGYSKHDLFL
jgi:hypothetical protein